MNSRSPLLRARRDSRSRPQERPRLSDESQATNESHMLWEGERKQRELRQGPLSGSFDAKTYAEAVNGTISITTVLFAPDGSVYERVPLQITASPVDVQKAYRVFRLLDAIPVIDIEERSLNALLAAVTVAVFKPELAGDRRVANDYDGLRGSIGPDAFDAILKSQPTHLDTVMIACQEGGVTIDTDALSAAMMDGHIPESKYLVREHGVEDPAARRQRLQDEQAYLVQFQDSLTAVYAQLGVEPQRYAAMAKQTLLTLREMRLSVKRFDLHVGLVAARICIALGTPDMRSVIMQAVLSSVLSGGLDDDGPTAIMGSLELPNPLLSQVTAIKRAVQVTKVAVSSQREDQKFQWTLTGLLTDVAVHELQKKNED